MLNLPKVSSVWRLPEENSGEYLTLIRLQKMEKTSAMLLKKDELHYNWTGMEILEVRENLFETSLTEKTSAEKALSEIVAEQLNGIAEKATLQLGGFFVA